MDIQIATDVRMEMSPKIQLILTVLNVLMALKPLHSEQIVKSVPMVKKL